MRALPAAAAIVLLTLPAGCATTGGGVVAPDGGAETRDGVVASADGVPIHYRVAGRGSPVLVFLHCWSCDASYWTDTMEAFKDHRRVVAIDLAGHGASGSGRTSWTITAFAADVRAVLDELAVTHAVLVGHSMSGLVAVDTARLLPQRIVAIIPVDTLHDAEYLAPADEFEAFLDSLRRDFPAGAAAFVRGMFPEGADSDLVERVTADMASAPPENAIAMLRGLFAYDPTQALPQVRAPIRCLNGDRYPTNLEVNRRYAPDFDAVIMEGVGHFPMLEAPREFRKLLTRLVDTLAPVGSE